MAILVTGSRGLVGGHFLENYGDRYEVIPVNRRDGIDILDFEGMRTALTSTVSPETIDAVVHLAAFTDVSRAHLEDGDQSGECYRLNVLGTRNIVRLANEFDAHLIHCSTDFVFGGEEDRPLTEEDAPAPIEWYGRTKLLGEEEVRGEARSWTIMRIAFPYSKKPGSKPDLVQNLIGKMTRDEPLFLFGDQVITPTFGEDIAGALDLFLRRKPRNEVYHVTGPESMSPFELGERLASHLGKDSFSLEETSLTDYLKKDPRPRQRFLRMDSSQYREFCRRNDRPLPRALEEVFPPANRQPCGVKTEDSEE